MKPLIMTFVCEHNKKKQYEIKPYFQLVKLTHNCFAYSDVISFFKVIPQSNYNILTVLLLLFNPNLTLPIWQNMYRPLKTVALLVEPGHKKMKHDAITLPSAIYIKNRIWIIIHVY